jgi:hypothetical protein
VLRTQAKLARVMEISATLQLSAVVSGIGGHSHLEYPAKIDSGVSSHIGSHLNEKVSSISSFDL